MPTMMNATRPVRGGHRVRTISGQLTSFIARYRERRAFRRNCVELESLSDRTLRDIGISRGEIPGLVADLQRSGSLHNGRIRRL